MINSLDTHEYILVLEKYMNVVFDNDWAKDVVHLIVKIINDLYVDVDCGVYYTIILKNGNVRVYDYHVNDQTYFGDDILVSKPIRHNVENVLKIGCNAFNVKFITDDGLYCWEKWVCDGSCGEIINELCINSIEYQGEKYKFMVTNISEIVCGGCHTFCVLKDGSLYGYGCNTAGELGLGDYDNRDLVKLNLVVNRVFTKFSHSFAFTKDDRVLGWGYNDNKQLGHNGVNNIPQELMLSNVIHICCSYVHSLAIVKSNDSMNKIYICGNVERDNNNFINGDIFIRELILVGGDWVYHIVSMVCGNHETMALINNGDVHCWSNDYCLGSDNYANTKCSPVKLSIYNVRLIKSGNEHNIFVTRSEEIYYRDSVNTGQINLDQYEDRCGAQQILRIDV